MLSIPRKIKGMNCRDLYFCDKLPDVAPGEDVQILVQSTNPIPDAEPFFTLIVNLLLDEEALLNAASKNLFIKIRRGRNRDRIMVTVINFPTDRDIEKFTSFYDPIAQAKGRNCSNPKKLMDLAKNHALVLAASSVEPNTEDWLSAHAYVCDGQRARVLYSVSNTRSSESSYRNLVGRANRCLHWHMMLDFKQAGYRLYDFGGLSKRSTLENVDNFKKAFGGKETLEYNLVRGTSIKGKVAVFLFRLAKELDDLKKNFNRDYFKR